MPVEDDMTYHRQNDPADLQMDRDAPPVYDSRIFLILSDNDNNQSIHTSRRILRPLLGLAQDIIVMMFDNSIDTLVSKLDDIKGFTAGVTSAKRFTSYPIALYYPAYFAYQQFFHSSFRARQGKALEEIILAILIDNFGCVDYNGTGSGRIKLMKKVVGIDTKKDMDAVGWNEDLNKLVLIQMRSRDDTGGTTAKASLIDYAREMIRLNKKGQLPKYKNLEILYIMAIWDDSRTSQKHSLLTKSYEALAMDIPTITKEQFVNKVPDGLLIDEQMTLKLTYGQEELIQSLCDWFNKDYNSLSHVIADIIHIIEKWDDLWVSYIIANMEIEQEKITGINNVKLLNRLMEKYRIELDFTDYKSLSNSIDTATSSLIPIWTEPSIRLSSPAQQAHYIRDLLYLKACYMKLKRCTNAVS